MTEAVGMPAADLEAFRADPIWPLRAATAPTIVRELDAAEHDPAIGFEALAATAVPVLQLVGGASARGSATGPRRSTGGWPMAASRSSTAPGMARTTATLPSSPPGSRRSSPPEPAPEATIVAMTYPATALPPTTARTPRASRASSPARRRCRYIDGEPRVGSCYRGYPIGDLVQRGTYAAVAELLWTGEWNPAAKLPCRPVPDAVLTALRALPRTAKPMDALRTAVSAWGAVEPTSLARRRPTQARALTAFSPSALAAFARIRQGKEPIAPDPDLDLVAGLPVHDQRHARPTPRPRGPSTRTSSSARSTASTPRRSPRA